MEKISYTTKELIAITGVTKDYWHMVARLGLFKPIRMGKKDIWLKKDLENYLEWAKDKDVSNEFAILKELAREREHVTSVTSRKR